MTVPQITERRIQKSKKPEGTYQYFITLPHEYAERLLASGVESLMIIFDQGLGAFPAKDPSTEKKILIFLKTHPEFMRIFTSSSKEASP